MSPDRGPFGGALRARREALGLTQEQVAEAAGISSSTVSRWERGESSPVPAQIDLLRGVLHLSEAEAAVWGSWLAPPPPPPLREREVSVELSYEVPEEWIPPRERISPPVLDRAALLGRRREHGAARHLSAVGGERFIQSADPFPSPPLTRRQDRIRIAMREGVQRRAELRRAREDRRRERDRRLRAVRGAAESGGGGALALPRVESAGYVPHGYSPESHLEEYLSIANTGSVFPVPSDTRGRRKYTYSDEEPASQEDWLRYLVRAVALVLVLGGLAVLLAWAVVQLGEGWSAVIDLFRDHSTATTSPAGQLTGALGLIAGR